MHYIVQMRRGNSKQWSDNDIIPLEGELVVEIDDVNNLHKLKIGDGVHSFSELPYFRTGDEVVAQILSQIAPRVVSVELTTNWIEFSEGKYGQVVAFDNITEHSRLDLHPSIDMLTEFKQLGLAFIAENNGGIITVYSVGNIPSIPYTIQATIVETKCDEGDILIGALAGAPGTQANWDQTDATKSDYIQNKPNLADYATMEWVKEYIASILK